LHLLLELTKYIFLFFLIINTISAYSQKLKNIENEKNSIYILLERWENIKNKYEYKTVHNWEQLFETAFKKIEQYNSEDLKIRISLALGSIYHDQGKFEIALPILKKCYLKKEILSLKNKARLLVKLEEEFRVYLDIRKAIIIRQERIDSGYINNFWAIYNDCKLYESAIKDFLDFELLPSIYSLGRLEYYLNLGNLYLNLSQFDSLLAIAKIGSAEANIIIERNKVSKLYRNNDLFYYKGYFLGMIAKSYMAKNKYAEAIPLLLKDIAYSNENIGNKADKLIELSICYLNTGKINLVKKLIASAEMLIQKMEFKDIKSKLNKTKSAYFEVIKKYDSALYYSKKYSEMKDSINIQIENNQSILILTKFELDNRRNEIKLKNLNLLKVISENENANARIFQLSILITVIIISLFLLFYFFIQNSKAKKIINLKNEALSDNIMIVNKQTSKNEFLLKELHHRVKNNLQLIYSLLNLQKRRIDNIDNKENLVAVQNRIHTMSLVHEFLYNSENYEYVNVFEYVKTLSAYLITIYKKEGNVEIEYAIDEEIELETERMIYLGLIINEILSNTFKFELNAHKILLIKICIQSIDGIIEVLIKDNGPGFIKENIKVGSLGLKLITIMCAQLDAEHEINSDNGVSHKIKFSFVKP
jgi:two-component sensor histidine kinase